MSLFAVIAVVVALVLVVVLISTLSGNTDKSLDSASSSEQMSDKEKEAHKKEKQEREWAALNENAKYVCQGGKVQCPFASPDTADIIVTSTTIKLQDKPWATVGDKDGKVNFNFTGLCKHPSHGSNKPPCKAVISLGEWKDYSETLIDNKNALVVRSTIPCMVSSQDLRIIDSGQTAELEKLEPTQKRIPKVTDVYWKEDGSDEKLYIEYPDYPVTMYIETEDYNPDEIVKVRFVNEEGRLFAGNKKELIVSGKVGSNGIAVIKNFEINYEEQQL
ncbi:MULTISPECIES: DUF4280 domain-containing protein [unclassified Dysgonomonas]|uniref:DUF4280 domain-containing protein n=1 Tax=unclassified Dysgonomonas TaxID=2630389 RepID=UPI002475A6CD|nr:MULTISPECIES: DUF4280 domain-containing protein [unclassified Dysgonomonas]